MQHDNSHIWDRRLDYAERHPILYPFWWVLGITLGVLAIAAVVGVASTGSVFFKSASSSATVKARTNIERNSTGNAVTSIAFFHDQCQAYNRQVVVVGSNTARADKLAKQAQGVSDPIAAQQAASAADQASTDAAGAFNVLAGIATDYNAKAANSLNAKFREAGLPDRLPTPSSPDGQLSTINCG